MGMGRCLSFWVSFLWSLLTPPSNDYTFDDMSYEAVLIQHNPTFTLDVHWMWPSCVLVAASFESPMCFRCGVFIFVFIKKTEHIPGFGDKLV